MNKLDFTKPYIAPCVICGAADSRDDAHKRGCPTMEPLTKPELLALAREIEDGWLEQQQKRENWKALCA